MYKNFLSLPLLVHLKIFSCLSPPEYTILSLCSRRTRYLVKCRKKERLELKIHVESRQKISFYALESDKTEHKLMVFERDLEPNCTGKLRIGGVVLEYQSHSDESGTIHFKYHYNQNPMENLAFSLSDLFHKPGSITWKLEILDFLKNPIRKSIIPKEISGNALEVFYTLNPNQQFSMVEEGWNLWALEHHKILHQRNLVLKKLRPNLLSFLINFRGENAVFECVYFEDLHVKEFLKQWILKENDPLKSMIIKQQIRRGARVDDVLEAVRHLESIYLEADQNYPYEEEIQLHYQFPPELFDCTEGFDIKRETDGKMATIKFTEEYFLFLVWP